MPRKLKIAAAVFPPLIGVILFLTLPPGRALAAFLLLAAAGGIAVFGFLSLNRRARRTNYYRNRHIPQQTFAQVRRNLKIVNLGSSQPAFAFSYRPEDEGMNWAAPPQAFEYDFRILKHFHSYLAPRATVLIPVCPFSFLLLRYPARDAGWKYYGVIDRALIPDFSREGLLRLRYPILFPGQWLRLFRDSRPFDSFARTGRQMTEAELAKDADNRIAGWKRDLFPDWELPEKSRTAIESNIAIVREMLDFCVEREYRPVFVVLPCSQTLAERFPERFIEQYVMDNIRRCNEKHRAPVLNFFDDPEFSQNRYYANSFFFKPESREKFTRHLLEVLHKTETEREDAP